MNSYSFYLETALNIRKQVKANILAGQNGTFLSHFKKRDGGSKSGTVPSESGTLVTLVICQSTV